MEMTFKPSDARAIDAGTGCGCSIALCRVMRAAAALRQVPACEHRCYGSARRGAVRCGARAGRAQSHHRARRRAAIPVAILSAQRQAVSGSVHPCARPVTSSSRFVHIIPSDTYIEAPEWQLTSRRASTVDNWSRCVTGAPAGALCQKGTVARQGRRSDHRGAALRRDPARQLAGKAVSWPRSGLSRPHGQAFCRSRSVSSPASAGPFRFADRTFFHAPGEPLQRRIYVTSALTGDGVRRITNENTRSISRRRGHRTVAGWC